MSFFEKKQKNAPPTRGFTPLPRAAGFSLVELMVSLTVFSIVVVVALGTLLVLIDVNSKAQALFSSTTNLSFALDAMSREVRTGYDYYCETRTSYFDEAPPSKGATQDCVNGNFIAFTRERDGERFAFQKNGDRLEQYDGTNWIPITSDRDVVISNFVIDVEDTAPLSSSNNDQPTASIYIDGFMYNGLDSRTEFNIQTRVTQRRIDI